MNENMYQMFYKYWPFLILPLLFLYRFYKTKKVNEEILAIKNFDDIQFVDVRTESEFLNLSIPKSINIPLQTIKTETSQLSKGSPVVVFCASGTRSSRAQKILKEQAFEHVINGGGFLNIKKILKNRK